VLFVGDAEHEEERALEPLEPVSVLQVGHHGSGTSSTPGFLSRVRPRYAVISAGGPSEKLNREYCHPRTLVVRRLTRLLGGPGTRTLESFDGERCDRATPADWVAEPASDRLCATGTWCCRAAGEGRLCGRGDVLARPACVSTRSRTRRASAWCPARRRCFSTSWPCSRILRCAPPSRGRAPCGSLGPRASGQDGAVRKARRFGFCMRKPNGCPTRLYRPEVRCAGHRLGSTRAPVAQAT
jgi:hypothetical protein